MSTAPEECTTWAALRKHLSTTMSQRLRTPGRAGHTLCSQYAYDETALKSEPGSSFNKVIADLPLCKKCERVAERVS